MGEDASYTNLTPGNGRRLRIVVFLGTRPEAIKLVPIVLAARAHPDLAIRVVGSGQHPAAMLEVLERFQVGLDGEIGLFRERRSLAGLTVGALEGFTAELAASAPDLVVVQGDTTTAFGGALAAFYLRLPVAHVEAGLRTGESHEPFPEEMNRRLIDSLSSHLFAPTAGAAQNLAAEGRDGRDVYVTGNTIVDSLQAIVADERTSMPRNVTRALEDRRWEARVLVTTHRRESWGKPMEEIAAAIVELAGRFPGVLFLLPLHPNPIVRGAFARHLPAANMLVVEPLGYAPFVAALERTDLVLTDSGGVLEEATALGKPILIMRERTERPEAVTAGVARLVGVGREAIVASGAEMLAELWEGGRWIGQGVFGDGRAGHRTVDWLRWRYGLAPERPAEFTQEPEGRPGVAATVLSAAR